MRVADPGQHEPTGLATGPVLDDARAQRNRAGRRARGLLAHFREYRLAEVLYRQVCDPRRSRLDEVLRLAIGRVGVLHHERLDAEHRVCGEIDLGPLRHMVGAGGRVRRRGRLVWFLGRRGYGLAVAFLNMLGRFLDLARLRRGIGGDTVHESLAGQLVERVELGPDGVVVRLPGFELDLGVDLRPIEPQEVFTRRQISERVTVVVERGEEGLVAEDEHRASAAGETLFPNEVDERRIGLRLAELLVSAELRRVCTIGRERNHGGGNHEGEDGDRAHAISLNV